MKGSFFCEACGAEVKGRSDSCPGCGRSFLGVRCPRCGKEGSADSFARGCPDCGYLTDIKSRTQDRSGPPSRPEKKRYKSRRDWPASRYWTLTALVVISVALILYFWLR